MNFFIIMNFFFFLDYCFNSIVKLFICYKVGFRLLCYYMENFKVNILLLRVEIEEWFDKNDVVEYFMIRYIKNDFVY